MSDEIRSITPEQWNAIQHNADALDDNKADNAPAVIEGKPDILAGMDDPVPPVPEIPDWTALSVEQKIDILHHKVDAIGTQVAWIGQTFQGVLNMVGSLSPKDLFKMVRGGK